VFNIKGNSYRLVTRIAYNCGSVYIQFIGTHAEYNKKEVRITPAKGGIMYKVIKAEKQYREYLAEIEKLMEIDPEEGTEERDKFDLLALLINEYEEKHYKIDLPDPVEAVKFRMEQMGLKAKDLVGIIGSKSKVSEVLNGKVKLSLNMIKALNAKLDIPAEVLVKDTDYYKILENDVTKLRVAEDKAEYNSEKLQACNEPKKH